MLKPHDRIFIHLDTILERDEMTDIGLQNRSGYYSALHCEQCGRAVKNVILSVCCCYSIVAIIYNSTRCSVFSDNCEAVIIENLYSPSKHGTQQTISNTNEIKQL